MIEKQKTIRSQVLYKGIGLHTGNMSTVRFLPAPANSGVLFVRTDLPGKPRIPAAMGNVISVIRGTTIAMDEENRVHTVEHVCSALFGLGIDNVVVEINANEPPVGDGSAKPFVEALLKTGTEEQDAPKNIFTPKEKITYSANESMISIEPADDLTIHCQLVYDHPLIGNQEATFLITPETYVKEICAARTFGFDYEVEALKRKGLARGGSLDNAIVVGMDRIYNREKVLRYTNEFVRHKVLDFLGDLYLLGCSVKGKINAVKIGHGHNINFVKKLAEAKSMGEKTHV